MTKNQAKTALGLTTDAALARFLGCTRAAVGLWGADEPMPLRWQWVLHGKKPRTFPKPKVDE